MPPKPNFGDSITLTGREASGIRAGILTGGSWQYKANEIGKVMGLDCTRNGYSGSVFKAAIAKIGLEYKDGSFNELTDGNAAATASTSTIDNAPGVTVKKRKATSGALDGAGRKRVKMEQADYDETGEDDESKDCGDSKGGAKQAGSKVDAIATSAAIKTEKPTE